MRIHHLNCGTLCPRGARMIAGQGKLLDRASLVCHCLLIETGRGLVLVDAGVGLEDIKNPKPRLGRGFLRIAHPSLDENETALRQIEGLGFKASDVTDILLTHLDPDHAGGISDFPGARVHVFGTEFEAANARRSLLEKERYRTAQWAHQPNWVIHRAQGETWKGFRSIQALDERDPEILLIPLIGHTRGHCGIAIRDPEGEGWLLHAGDAYFYHGEIHTRRPRCPKGLEVFQRIIQQDGQARVENQAKLRTLASDPSAHTRIICSHDPWELQRERDAQSPTALEK